ncbi:MAG: hypothetical protein BZY88_12240 [SAR202 cluster bacterium Io17-Chloro-G9]|nr:MAG: hypothetical protein BZY88_12240 [SAR202 cluster bacterium Io17-Chloro-G9]
MVEADPVAFRCPYINYNIRVARGIGQMSPISQAIMVYRKPNQAWGSAGDLEFPDWTAMESS